MDCGGAAREAQNWRIHLLFVRKEYSACLALIEETLKICYGVSEWPLYVKGLILRQQGKIEDSLKLFQACLCLNPTNTETSKQIGRSLFLLGRHKLAIEVMDEAIRQNSEDWELYYGRALCYMYLKAYPEAIESLRTAKEILPHEYIFTVMGKIYCLLEDYQSAINCYREAIEVIPENVTLLITLGLAYLRVDDQIHAFEYLGNALAFDPKNSRAILALGSIQQDNNESDVALSKYRISAVSTPHSPHLWNNIGLCYLSQNKFLAVGWRAGGATPRLSSLQAISCLKRALYLGPFEWIILYNLGVTHLIAGQYFSAFQYLSAAVSMNPNYAKTYSLMATALSYLDDWDNSFAAYERALELENDSMTQLNYAITLMRRKLPERARVHYSRFRERFDPSTMDSRDEKEISERRAQLDALLA